MQRRLQNMPEELCQRWYGKQWSVTRLRCAPSFSTLKLCWCATCLLTYHGSCGVRSWTMPSENLSWRGDFWLLWVASHGLKTGSSTTSFSCPGPRLGRLAVIVWSPQRQSYHAWQAPQKSWKGRSWCHLVEVPEKERIYVLETDVSDDFDSVISDQEIPADACRAWIWIHCELGWDAIYVPRLLSSAFQVFLVGCLALPCERAQDEACLTRGSEPRCIPGDDAQVIRMEALVDDAFDAVMHANEQELGSMLRHINPNLTDERGFSLLMMAAQTSEVRIMQMLLNARANINQTDKDNGWTALRYLLSHLRPAERPGISWSPKDLLSAWQAALEILLWTLRGTTEGWGWDGWVTQSFKLTQPEGQNWPNRLKVDQHCDWKFWLRLALKFWVVSKGIPIEGARCSKFWHGLAMFDYFLCIS